MRKFVSWSIFIRFSLLNLVRNAFIFVYSMGYMYWVVGGGGNVCLMGDCLIKKLGGNFRVTRKWYELR